VTVDVTANDGPGNLGGTLQVPTIPNQPANGTATVNGAGKIVYTPADGFYGEDIIVYQVCETPSGLCTTAKLVVTVLRPEGANTLIASDDYMSTPRNATLTVTAAKGVLANDTDPDAGDVLTVTAQPSTLITGVGTLVLATDGSYTFTPVSGYTGPASFAYTVCDNNANCATATLYILVEPVPNLAPTIPIDNLSFAPSPLAERDFVVKVSEKLGYATNNSSISFRVSRLSAFEITVPGITLSGTDNESAISGNSVVGGSTANENGQWKFRQDDNFIIVTSKPGKVVSSTGFANIGFHIKRAASVAVNTTQNITVTIVAGSGGEADSSDNTAVITVVAAPAN
jgi:hypothetical protein